MGIIQPDFMLQNDAARKLYHEFAESMPIIDYHCHLNPQLIAEDHRFTDPYELFLGGDHYKWRQMRSFGIPEEAITGDVDPYEKWVGFARVMPNLIGNPLYHWTALELKRYFGVDEPLTEKTAKKIWDTCAEQLKSPEFSAQQLITRSNVAVVCTTDDPADDLHYHQQIKASSFGTKVLPAFRPDKLINIHRDTFLEYLSKQNLTTYDGMLAWLESRIEYFHANGCRLSDHGLDMVFYAEGDAKAVFDKKLAGGVLTAEEVEIYQTAVLRFCAKSYARHGWTMQLHIGATRNNNTRMFRKLGPDTGFDSVNDRRVAEPLVALLDSLEVENCLPKTILYTLNPKDNYVLATLMGSFQNSDASGKLQFGSGWWFNDHKDGMQKQMTDLANLGVLGKFVGMLTDSRSFVSYPRHEYFRRILCNLLGTWVEDGEYPQDWESLEKIVRGISYENAKEYFGF